MTPRRAAVEQPSQIELGQSKGRKPWVKKTPLETVRNQIERIREGLAAEEEQFKERKRQLKKLEEIEKILASE